MCSKLNLSKDNENFIKFLTSDIDFQILKENMLSIDIETGNIFYDNYNTNESIYHLLLRQQGETKKNNPCNLKLQRIVLELFEMLFG